jgi:hypothetical protein
LQDIDEIALYILSSCAVALRKASASAFDTVGSKYRSNIIVAVLIE